MLHSALNEIYRIFFSKANSKKDFNEIFLSKSTHCIFIFISFFVAVLLAEEE